MNEDTWHPWFDISTEDGLENAVRSVRHMARTFNESWEDSLSWHVGAGYIRTEDADKVRAALAEEHVDVL